MLFCILISVSLFLIRPEYDDDIIGIFVNPIFWNWIDKPTSTIIILHLNTSVDTRGMENRSWAVARVPSGSGNFINYSVLSVYDWLKNLKWENRIWSNHQSDFNRFEDWGIIEGFVWLNSCHGILISLIVLIIKPIIFSS